MNTPCLSPRPPTAITTKAALPAPVTWMSLVSANVFLIAASSRPIRAQYGDKLTNEKAPDHLVSANVSAVSFSVVTLLSRSSHSFRPALAFSLPSRYRSGTKCCTKGAPKTRLSQYLYDLNSLYKRVILRGGYTGKRTHGLSRHDTNFSTINTNNFLSLSINPESIFDPHQKGSQHQCL